ncbi:MAG: SDR family NAD(P)-dependent oxidoreductase [Chloroflexota bacterium]
MWLPKTRPHLKEEDDQMARRILKIDSQTAAKDISGKVYIVTGANSGVGLETTRQLVKQGGHVVMACRRIEAGEAEAQSFHGLKGSYEVMRLDLADLQSVRDFVDAFSQEHNRLDGLACNAGLVDMAGDGPNFTKDGLEMTIGISYFGHFLLTELLLETLKKSAPSRMVILSSVVHAGNPKNRPKVHLDDLNFKNRPYNNFAAYAEAKVATNLYAMELGKRLEGTGVSAFSVHPGWARSNFGSGGNFIMRTLMGIARPLTRSMSDSNEDSAQTSLHCLLSDDAPNHSGAYFSQSSVLYRDPGTKDGGWPMTSPNPHAKDLETARKLVDLSYGLVGLKEKQL